MGNNTSVIRKWDGNREHKFTRGGWDEKMGEKSRSGEDGLKVGMSKTAHKGTHDCVHIKRNPSSIENMLWEHH